jgi:HEAT repeat protein
VNDASVAGGASGELERAILLLQDPFGDEPHSREQEGAVRYLLAHPEAAHPLLLELLRSHRATNPYAVLEALPRFGLPESVPVLNDVLESGPENLSGAAADALARHPLPAAYEALVRALRHPVNAVVVAAAAGLMTRGDTAACPALREVVGHADPVVRYHAVQAAGRLGCLDRDTLAALARRDRDQDVRELARRLMRDRSA